MPLTVAAAGTFKVFREAFAALEFVRFTSAVLVTLECFQLCVSATATTTATTSDSVSACDVGRTVGGGGEADPVGRRSRSDDARFVEAREGGSESALRWISGEGGRHVRQYQRRNGTRGGGGNCSAGSCQAVIHRGGVSALVTWC